MQQDLAIFNSWHLTFLIISHSPFQKNETKGSGIFGYWVVGAGS